jgi:hypothetical protein
MKSTKKKAAVFEDQIITIAPLSYTKKVRDSLIDDVVARGGCPVENVNPHVRPSSLYAPPPLLVNAFTCARMEQWSERVRRLTLRGAQVDFVVCSNREKDDSEVLAAASRFKIPLVTYAPYLFSLSLLASSESFVLTRQALSLHACAGAHHWWFMRAGTTG